MFALKTRQISLSACCLSVIVLLLFGGKKIPELMKGLGKGVKSFKDGMNGKLDDEQQESKKKDE